MEERLAIAIEVRRKVRDTEMQEFALAQFERALRYAERFESEVSDE